MSFSYNGTGVLVPYYGISAEWMNNANITNAEQFIDQMKINQKVIGKGFAPDYVPVGNYAYNPIGHMINEPPEKTKLNVRFKVLDQSDDAAGDVITKYFNIISTQIIKPGEELFWCYGNQYVRNYKSNC